MTTEHVLAADADDRRDAVKWMELAVIPLQDTTVAPSSRLIWIALQAADSRLTRNDLRRATGLSAGAVHNNVERLEEAGLLEVTETSGRDAETLYRPAWDVEGGVQAYLNGEVQADG